MPSQLSDCTRCNLRAPKIQNFLGGRPPRPPQKPVFEVHRTLHTKFTLPPLKPKISILPPPPPPLANFLKKTLFITPCLSGASINLVDRDFCMYVHRYALYELGMYVCSLESRLSKGGGEGKREPGIQRSRMRACVLLVHQV